MVWQFIDALSFSPRQGENSTIFIIFYFLFLISYLPYLLFVSLLSGLTHRPFSGTGS